ncbi:type III pantothenate kinase [Spiroplasma endosymbiont of Anurida maritima]|uniref:type III pantothenate kinase n=1 Tax=Spiroplasma endosymbiont of Anurida maritima TaxID=2967972 RepID=UPI0036D31EBC
MNLLVDVGNTFTKISLYDKKANKIIRVYNFKTDATILEHVFYEELKEALIIEGYSIYDISKLLLSSVTPKWNNFIEKLCNFFNIIFYNVEDFYKTFYHIFLSILILV